MATALTQISGYAHVAVAYGMEEAVFLNAIMFWYRTNRGNNQNFHVGRWWTYNSVKAFEEIFPWWNGGQIRRIIARCKDKGALLAGSYNENPLDRTAWYTPSDELLGLYGESANCICRKQQMQLSETAETFDENGKCYIRNTCSNHEETDNTPYSPPEGDGAVPDPAPVDKPSPKPKTRRTRQKKSVPVHAPERFEQFWAVYPVGGSRLKAVEAWDALAPSDELIDEARHIVDEAIQKCLDRGVTDWGKLKNTTKDTLSDYVWKKTKRRPMILPIIMEVD